MSYYSLLPGTNQFIEKNGNQGQSILRKHGYNASRRPNHYDYYRALQGEQREGLFDDLASVLGSVAKVWGASTPTRNSAISSSNSTQNNSVSNLGAGMPFQIGGIPANPLSNYFGNQKGGVPRGPGRDAAYLELVNHFRNESIRRNYMKGLEANNYYQEVPAIYSVGVQFASDDDDQYDQSSDQSGNGRVQAQSKGSGDSGNSNGFDFDGLVKNIRTPLFIIAGIVLALIIWSKVR
jgi:hypothetical protein